MNAQLLCGVLLAALALTAQAQTYPARPVRLIVPLAAGGGMDTVARGVALKLTDSLGQTVVVDNRGGGGGSIGAELVAAAAPDGYTLIMMSSTSVIHPLMVKARFEVLRDFAPISQVTTQPYVIVVNPKLPIQSVSELIGYAKANPDKLNFASSGNGSLIHLATELFKSVTGTRMVHIPYKGIGAAYPDLIAGNIQLIFASIISAQPHVKAQRIRALAVTGAKRAQSSPELPTVAEAGVKGYVVNQWYAVFAPAGTPRAVVDRLYRDIVKALQLPEVAARLAADGAESVGSTPQQLAAHVKAQRIRALAVTGAKRAQSSPELPTVAEAGVKGYVVNQWYAVFAPAGAPRAVVDRLYRDIVKALQLPEVAARLAADGAESVGSTPQQLAAHVKAERDKWAKVIRDTGIKGD